MPIGLYLLDSLPCLYLAIESEGDLDSPYTPNTLMNCIFGYVVKCMRDVFPTTAIFGDLGTL